MHSSSSIFEQILNGILLVVNLILMIIGITLCFGITLLKYTKLVDYENISNELFHQIIKVKNEFLFQYF